MLSTHRFQDILRSVAKIEEFAVNKDSTEFWTAINELRDAVENPASTLSEVLHALARIQHIGFANSRESQLGGVPFRRLLLQFWHLVKALPNPQLYELLSTMQTLEILQIRSLGYARRAIHGRGGHEEVELLLFLLAIRIEIADRVTSLDDFIRQQQFDRAVVDRLIDLVEEFRPHQYRTAITLLETSVDGGEELRQAVRQVSSDRAAEFSNDDLGAHLPRLKDELLPHQHERFREELAGRIRRASARWLPELQKLAERLYPGDRDFSDLFESVRLQSLRSFSADEARILAKLIDEKNDAHRLRGTVYADDIEQRALELLPVIGAKHLPDLILLLVVATIRTPTSTAAVADAVQRLIYDLSAKDLARIFSSLANARLEQHLPVKLLSRRIEEEMDGVSLEGLGNYVMLLTQQNVERARRMLKRINMRNWRGVNLPSNFLKGVHVASVLTGRPVTDELQTAVEDLLSKRAASKPEFPNGSERLLASLLTKRGFQVYAQQVVGYFSTDLLVQSPTTGRSLIVEFDGLAFHYLATAGENGDRRTGMEVIRDRYHARLGYPVVRVPEDEMYGPGGFEAAVEKVRAAFAKLDANS